MPTDMAGTGTPVRSRRRRQVTSLVMGTHVPNRHGKGTPEAGRFASGEKPATVDTASLKLDSPTQPEPDGNESVLVDPVAALYDKMIYDADGFDAHGYDRHSFDKYGAHRNGTRRDDEGHDQAGFNMDGYYRKGTRYDDDGYDQAGFNRDGFDKYGYNRWHNFNRDGFNKDVISRS